jgi:hypothetical protein
VFDRLRSGLQTFTTLEFARLLVPFNHVASLIVNANNGRA